MANNKNWVANDLVEQGEYFDLFVNKLRALDIEGKFAERISALEANKNNILENIPYKGLVDKTPSKSAAETADAIIKIIQTDTKGNSGTVDEIIKSFVNIHLSKATHHVESKHLVTTYLSQKSFLNDYKRLLEHGALDDATKQKLEQKCEDLDKLVKVLGLSTVEHYPERRFPKEYLDLTKEQLQSKLQNDHEAFLTELNLLDKNKQLRFGKPQAENEAGTLLQSAEKLLIENPKTSLGIAAVGTAVAGYTLWKGLNSTPKDPEAPEQEKENGGFLSSGIGKALSALGIALGITVAVVASKGLKR